MNLPILNRAGKLPDDGWYQIEVPGEHVNHRAKVIQVIDREAIDAIVNRFAEEAKKPNFPGLLVDQDHFSLDDSKPTEAMGWAMEVRNRDGLPEARIEWTSAGRPKVEGKDYKFFSTVYHPGDCKDLGTRIVNGKPYRLVRPLALERIALTNDPNNKGGKPISNRGGKSADAAETTTMKQVLKLLGLADDASEDSAVSAVKAILNRATTAEGRATTLETENKTLVQAQVESDLEKYKNRFKPENRDKIKAQLIANRAGTLEILEAIPEPAAPADGARRITNRAGAAAPSESTPAEKLEQERMAAVEQHRIANRCSFEEAWNATRRAKPELFQEQAAN